MTRHSLDSEPMTDGQRRALFAAARAQGMSRDDLRDMTPTGSVKALSRAQATALLERLNGGRRDRQTRQTKRPSRLPPGVFRFVTDAQVRKVDALRIDLGWSVEDLRSFLSERHYADGRPMATPDRCPAMDSSADGVQVIELLKSVSNKADRAAERRRSQADRR